MVKVILALSNSVAIILTQDLFLLWIVLKHSRVGLAGVTDTACFPPSELKGTYMHSLPKQEPGFLKSQLPQPLAVLTYTMRLAPSLHCFVYKAIIFISIYTIATSVLT